MLQINYVVQHVIQPRLKTLRLPTTIWCLLVFVVSAVSPPWHSLCWAVLQKVMDVVVQRIKKAAWEQSKSCLLSQHFTPGQLQRKVGLIVGLSVAKIVLPDSAVKKGVPDVLRHSDKHIIWSILTSLHLPSRSTAVVCGEDATSKVLPLWQQHAATLKH